MTNRLTLLAALAAAVAATACLDTTTSYYRRTLALPESFDSTGGYDATIRSDAVVYDTLLTVGDDAGNLALRGTVSFAIGYIPAGVQIESARLSVRQCAVTGDPYGAFGNIVVDHINMTGGKGGDLFASRTLDSNLGTLSNSAALETKTVDVKAHLVEDLVAGRGTSSYRFRFANAGTDNDSTADAVSLGLPRDGTPCGQSSPPLLIVVVTA